MIAPKGELMYRRLVVLMLVFMALAAAPAPAAADVLPFDAKAFADAQAAGQSVVVEVHATW